MLTNDLATLTIARICDPFDNLTFLALKDAMVEAGLDPETVNATKADYARDGKIVCPPWPHSNEWGASITMLAMARIRLAAKRS